MIGTAIGAAGIGATVSEDGGNVAYITLDDWSLVASGVLAVSASTTVTLDDWTLVAIGGISSTGVATVALDDWTIVATAEISGKPICLRLSARSTRLPIAARGARSTRMTIHGGCH